MAHDTRSEILTGILGYLRTHFPDVVFTAKDDAKTHSVMLLADGRPRYRLEITGQFLDGDAGTTKSLGRLQQWGVAETLREAKSKLVTLATTGVHTSDPRQWVQSPPRRQS